MWLNIFSPRSSGEPGNGYSETADSADGVLPLPPSLVFFDIAQMRRFPESFASLPPLIPTQALPSASPRCSFSCVYSTAFHVYVCSLLAELSVDLELLKWVGLG